LLLVVLALVEPALAVVPMLAGLAAAALLLALASTESAKIASILSACTSSVAVQESRVDDEVTVGSTVVRMTLVMIVQTV
jgi:hypothetical protein